MKLSEQLQQSHDGGDFGQGLTGYAEQARALEHGVKVLAAQRDQALAHRDRVLNILGGIFGLLNPRQIVDSEGRTWQFKSPTVEWQLQALSDRIRALPDEMEAAAEAHPDPQGYADLIHYPKHWDTAAYPTLESAVRESLAWAGCRGSEDDTEPSRIFIICDWYESGYGHGYAGDGLDLSRTPHADLECGEAYQVGYEAGQHKRKRMEEEQRQ